jgi:hypothetical protein
MTEHIRCGRPTKAARPCRNERIAVGEREWPTCSRHATDEENAEHFAAVIRAREEADRVILENHQALPVACWSWPVTGEDLERAVEARGCTDPEQAYRLAWKLLADWQARRCAVCGAREDRYLDHSHETGLVRGWLCRSCNISEGFADVRGGQFERYRERNPASILGIEIRYRNPFPSWGDPVPAELDRSPGYLLATYLADGAPDD